MGDMTLIQMAMKQRNEEPRSGKWTRYDLLAIPVAIVLLLILALCVVVASVVGVFSKVDDKELSDRTDAT